MGSRRSRANAVIRRALVIVLALGAPACHHATPTQPCASADCAPVQTLSLVCPSDVSLTTPSATVTTATVTYGMPTVTGGTPPVTSSCTPASPSVFASGTTMVTCTATDAIARAATCSLGVTVNVPSAPIPMLQGTTLWAFGDSITAGENGCDNPCTLSIDQATAYPTVLGSLLAARYTHQVITVTNYGQPLETAEDGAQRLKILLQSPVPDALLLLEGVNDFNSEETPTDIIGALQADVDQAKARGVKRVFLATLTPEIAPGSRAVGIPPIASSDLVATTNTLIRNLAAQEGVVLVDLYGALIGDVHQDVADPAVTANDGEPGDGLHLTIAGRAAVAQVFFVAIEANFEAASSTQRVPARLSPNSRRPAVRR